MVFLELILGIRKVLKKIVFERKSFDPFFVFLNRFFKFLNRLKKYKSLKTLKPVPWFSKYSETVFRFFELCH